MIKSRVRSREEQSLFDHDQTAISALFRVVDRYVGNLAPMPCVFPDYPARIARNAGTDRELMKALHRHEVRQFNPDRKYHPWTSRKLKRDE